MIFKNKIYIDQFIYIKKKKRGFNILVLNLNVYMAIKLFCLVFIPWRELLLDIRY